MKTPIKFVTLLLVFAWVVSGMAAEVDKVEEQTFELAKGARVILEANDGQVIISTWDRKEAWLKITKTVWHRDQQEAEELLGELQVDIDHAESRLFIRERPIRHARGFWHARDRWDRDFDTRIDYELKLPEQTESRVITDEGGINVSGVYGYLDLRVDEGNISLRDVRSGDLDAEMDEGDLDATNFSAEDARLRVESDEGRIRISDSRFSEVVTQSDEGRCQLRNVTLTNCSVRTDEGDVELDLHYVDEGRCKVRTDEGNVALWLPADANVSLQLETADGRIRSDYPVSVKDRRRDGERVDQKLGSGLTAIDVYTENGNIHLEKR